MEKTIYSREYAAVLRLLRKARKASGLTQVQIAKAMHQSQSFISKIELGDRRLDIIQLRTLLKAFGVKLTDFVHDLERELSRKN